MLAYIGKGGRHHRLSSKSGYRYISPSIGHQEGLEAFYGPDRSFCVGTLFDNTDIIVEFRITDWTGIEQISHHQDAYRGPLTRSNCKITAVLYHDPPTDYQIKEFAHHMNQIEQQVSDGTFFYQYSTDDSSLDMSFVSYKHVYQKLKN